MASDFLNIKKKKCFFTRVDSRERQGSMRSPKSSSRSSCLFFTGPASLSIIYLRLVPQIKATISLTCQNKKSRRCRGLSLPAVHTWDLSGLTLGRVSVRLSAGGGEVPSVLPLGPYLDVWQGLALFPLLNQG